MTRLLLSCDDYFYCHEGEYYYRSQTDLDLYRRYLRVFDKVRLVARCAEEKELNPKRIPFSEEPRIECIPIPFFQGPKEYAKVYFKVGKAMKNTLKGCDAAVLRIPATVALRMGYKVMKSGLPYACEVVFDAEDGAKGEKGINRLVWKRIDKQMRTLCSNAEGVSCVTELYLQKHYYSTKPNAFTSNYSSLALPAGFYGEVRQFPGKKTMLIAHTANQVEFEGRKGHKEIIEALSKLRNRGVDVKVQFAGADYFGGEAKLRAYAEQLGISDYVEFLGYISRERLNQFLCEADMYVMPTWAEGLPRVIIEAMAKGLPCITTPVSGNPELVDEHFLVPYYDTDTLADRIEELTTNSKLYEETSRINYERSKKYEATILQARRDDFYRKLKERINK